MKTPLLLCAALLMCVAPSYAARQNALEKEMKNYARDFYRKHPDAAGDKKVRDARESLIKKTKASKVLELTKVQEKKMRKREELVSAGIYKAAMDQLKALNSKEPEVTFLIKYAETEKITPVKKLLIHRLSLHFYTKAQEKAAEERSKRMHAVLAKYTEYKSANGKAPRSLSDLNLPENCKQFVDSATGEKSDWIYVGHLSTRLKSGNSYVVLAEPIPFNDARTCGLDSGAVTKVKESSIKGALDKILNASGGSGGGQPGSPALKSLMKKYRVYKQLHSNTAPKSLSDLDLTAEEKQYTDPDGGTKLDWIFLGDKSSIKVSGGVAVVIISPKPYKGNRIAGLADGRHIVIPDASVSKHLPK